MLQRQHAPETTGQFRNETAFPELRDFWVP